MSHLNEITRTLQNYNSQHCVSVDVCLPPTPDSSTTSPVPDTAESVDGQYYIGISPLSLKFFLYSWIWLSFSLSATRIWCYLIIFVECVITWPTFFAKQHWQQKVPKPQPQWLVIDHCNTTTCNVIYTERSSRSSRQLGRHYDDQIKSTPVEFAAMQTSESESRSQSESNTSRLLYVLLSCMRSAVRRHKFLSAVIISTTSSAYWVYFTFSLSGDKQFAFSTRSVTQMQI